MNPLARRLTTSVVVFALAAGVALAGNPGMAIAEGRQHIQNKEYNRAVKSLQDAIPDAAHLQEPQRTQAMAALYFYTALAFNSMNDPAKTRESLEQFFHFNPQLNTIDPAKFDATFVARFTEVKKAMERESSTNFEAAYPGYLTFAEETPRERPLKHWGEGPEMILLGVAEEKTQWKRLRDDAARRSFIDDFWQRRDRTQDTQENEFRTDFLRRVAFADHTFVTEKTRGSLTDRGRVFVLLGPPKVIRQNNLSQADGARVIGRPGPITAAQGSGSRASFAAMQLSEANLLNPLSDPVVKGKVERWVYNRDQLPKSFPDDYVVFKFITEEGYGDSVLQRDFLALKVLKDAGHM